MSKSKDNVAEILDKWYSVMDENNISVQPKSATILGVILSEYDISLKSKPRDIWQEYLTTKGGEFESWYEGLSPAEKHELDLKKEKVKSTITTKQLLKG